MTTNEIQRRLDDLEQRVAVLSPLVDHLVRTCFPTWVDRPRLSDPASLRSVEDMVRNHPPVAVVGLTREWLERLDRRLEPADLSPPARDQLAALLRERDLDQSFPPSSWLPLIAAARFTAERTSDR